ncbi:MAG: hypothetical protein NZ889_00805 [Candidatus Pacearchaeota archaeon]|nr:hypothetical protein [Candidatus Pacearchaeota archaeon]
MRLRLLMFLFGFLFFVVSGVALIKSSKPFEIFGFAISEKLKMMPSSQLFYIVVLFILSIVMMIVAITARELA